MRVCSFCNDEVYAVDGCQEHKLVFGDDTEDTISRPPDAEDLVDPIAYGEETGEDGTDDVCQTCRVEPGNYHHPGCAAEECPNCGEMLLNCACDPHALTWTETEP